VESVDRETCPTMKTLLLLLAVTALAVAGCTTKAKARADARAAFYAGQARVLSEQQQAIKQPPSTTLETVSILGPVQVSILKWTPDLTLTKVIVAAEYIPDGEPSRILIHRGNESIPVSPMRLLNGENIPILRGDVVELRP
jgi:hypothetical protein